MIQNAHEVDTREIYPLEARKRFEAINLLEGCEILCERNWNVPMLRYSYHRMYYILGGEAYYRDESRELHLEPGHLYVFPSQAKYYGLTHNPDDPLRVLWCHFEVVPDLLNDLIDFDPGKDADFMRLINLWKCVAALPQPGNEMQHATALLLYMLERRVEFQYANRAFNGIEHYVEEHIHEGIGVDHLSSHFGYTRSYFTRKFKSAYGLSPGEYLKVVRMSRAANMLKFGYNIGDVCETLGFTDKKVFSRTFRTYHGMSPSEYAKGHKLQP